MLTFTIDILNGIPQYVEAMELAVENTVMQAAVNTTNLARSMVAVDTGSLHDTIDMDQALGAEGTTNNHQWSVDAGNLEGGFKGGGKLRPKEAGAPVDYAEAQEFGGGPGHHQPFMTPAAEMAWPTYLQAMQQAIASIPGVI